MAKNCTICFDFQFKLMIFTVMMVAMTGSTLSLAIEKDTLPPKPEYVICHCCGKTHFANVKDKPDDVNISSKLKEIVFDIDKSFNFNFNYQNFKSGIDTIVDWGVQAINLDKDGLALITFIDNANNDTTITVEFIATKLKASPENLDFDMSDGKTEIVKTFTLKNSSTRSAPIIEKMEIWSGKQNFELLDYPLPDTIRPLEEREISVRFNKNSNGLYSDSLMIYDTCGLRIIMPLDAIVEGGDGVNDESSLAACQLTVFPNPSPGKITVGFGVNTDRSITVSLLSMAGTETMLYQGPVQKTIDFNLKDMGFPGAVYLLKVQDRTGIYTEKILLY